MHEDLLAYREEFPVLSRHTYLASHTLGAMHREAASRLAEYAEEWASDGVLAWDAWLPKMQSVADLVGSLFGAPPGTTVLRANVASALSDLASAVNFASPRDGVVTTALDWPGSLYFWHEQQARHGTRVTVVPADDDGIRVDVGRLVAAIDESTSLVSLSHVFFRSSTLVDVAPVVARAHAVGALVVLDCYQSVGALPFDVVALDVDAAVGGSVKYLCGGPGNGFLYVRSDVAESLRPTSVGWLSHERPFAFAAAPIAYAGGVARFTGGTPNVPAAFAAEPAYALLAKIGIDRIRERSLSLTQPLVEGALERGFTVRSPMDPDERGGHVTIDPGDAERVHAQLLEEGFVVDHRPGAGIRIGPHFYNSSDECAAILDAMVRARA
jgi:kynureninase